MDTDPRYQVQGYVGVEQANLNRTVFQADMEKLRLVDDIDRARNEAKFEVLSQLFGYEAIQEILDGSLKGS